MNHLTTTGLNPLYLRYYTGRVTRWKCWRVGSGRVGSRVRSYFFSV